MNMDFLKTCRYDDTGQLFFCDKSDVGDLHIMDMRGWGYFGKESDQKAVAEEIAKRIREFPVLQTENAQLREKLSDAEAFAKNWEDLASYWRSVASHWKDIAVKEEQ